MIYEPSTTDISKMKREDIVFELAKHCELHRHHDIIKFRTEHLRTLLAFYTQKTPIMPPRKHGREYMIATAGEAIKKGQLVMKTIHNPWSNDRADALLFSLFGNVNKEDKVYNHTFEVAGTGETFKEYPKPFFEVNPLIVGVDFGKCSVEIEYSYENQKKKKSWREILPIFKTKQNDY